MQRRVSEVKVGYQNGKHSNETVEPDFVFANGCAPIPFKHLPSTTRHSCATAVDEDEAGAFHQEAPPVLRRSHSFDEVLFDFRSVTPEDIAAQLTLIDLELFRAIGLEEFADGNWTKKDKQRRAPNIVAFTTRFNHTSFWVVKVILNESVVKIRAEILSQFIRVAKKLRELNNIHSLKAVLSGLQSAAVYRLSQTWKLVPKKDRVMFDKLEEFLSEADNRKLLREHMNEAKLPCIPFLGMYLTDLVYLDTVLAQNVTRQAQAQVETVMNTIAFCQNSSYDNLSPKPHIISYLNSVKYIDELQKFLEDENYKQSLRLEPIESTRQKDGELSDHPTLHPLRVTKSQEDLLTPSEEAIEPPKFSTPSCPPKQAQLKVYDRSQSSIGLEPASPLSTKKSTTIPRLNADHKHFSSGALLNNDAPLLTVPEPPEKKRLLPSSPWRGHQKSRSVGTNALVALGMKTSPPQSISSPEPHTSRSAGATPHDLDISSSSSSDDSEGGVCVNVEEQQTCSTELDQLSLNDADSFTVIKEGRLIRKIVKINGKSVSFSLNSKCWVELTSRMLLLHSANPKNNKKKQYKTNGLVLNCCRVKYQDPSEKLSDLKFVVTDQCGNTILFKAKTIPEAEGWVSAIRSAISEEEEREKQRTQQALIKL